LRDAKSEIIGRASVQVALISWETRRALLPDQVLGERLRVEAPRAFAEPFARLKTMGEATLSDRRYETRWQETDFNLHVTSATYLAWAVESVPVEVLERSSLAFCEVHHHAETDHPATVISRARAVAAPAEGAPVVASGVT